MAFTVPSISTHSRSAPLFISSTFLPSRTSKSLVLRRATRTTYVLSPTRFRSTPLVFEKAPPSAPRRQPFYACGAGLVTTDITHSANPRLTTPSANLASVIIISIASAVSALTTYFFIARLLPFCIHPLSPRFPTPCVLTSHMTTTAPHTTEAYPPPLLIRSIPSSSSRSRPRSAPLLRLSHAPLSTFTLYAHVPPPVTISTQQSLASPPKRGLLVLASLMFVVGAALASAETAITTLWPWKVRELADKEGENSPFARLESDLTRFLTTILVSTTTATVFSTAIATELAADVFGASAVAYVTAAMTVFFLFFGEILPKALAVHAPAKVARLMVPVISTLSIIVYPVGKLLAAVSTQILKLFNLPMENDATVSEEELRLIVAGADRSGSIEKYESQIIHNVLDLEETDVREVMCPRVDMVALSLTNTLAELLALESESHYSRMPVYEHTIDNIVGVAMVKSVLRYLDDDPSVLQTTPVSEIIDPAFFVPESMSVWIVLEEMRKRRLHMAIVVDEYGGTAGLVTLEDILEEVVGEIYDEDDDYEAESQFMEKGPDGRYVVEGQADLDKVGEALSMNLTEDDLHDYGTISGFLCARMGGIPAVGDQLVFNKVRFIVAQADDRRIVSLTAGILSEQELAQLAEDEEDMDESHSMKSASENSGNPNLTILSDQSYSLRDSKTKTASNGYDGNGAGGEHSLRKLISGVMGNDSSEYTPGQAKHTSSESSAILDDEEDSEGS